MKMYGAWSSRSLRFKLISAILISLIPMIAIVFVTYQYNKSTSVESSSNIMNLYAKNGARSINAFLAGQSKIFNDWVKDDIYGLAIEFNTQDEMKAQFTGMLQAAPDFSLLLLIDKNGTVLVVEGATQELTTKASSLKGMKIEGVSGLVQKGSVFADIVPNTIMKGLGDNSPYTMQYSFPAKNSASEPCGLLLAFLNWSSVQKQVVSIADEMKAQGMDNAKVLMVDKNGNMAISHSEIGSIGGAVKSSVSFGSWLSGNNELAVKTDEYDNVAHYATFARLYDGQNQVDKQSTVAGDTRIYLTIFVPESNIMGKVRQMLWISLLFGGIGALLALVVAFMLDKSIAKPIKGIIENLTTGANQVEAASSQVAGASQSLASGASEQASSLEETSSSLEEMSSMTRQNADNARQSNILASEASTAADKGASAMEGMSKAMQEIKKSSDETAKIIKVIDEIAFQTNLLALNAAVEAARAGEAGKGFAVVAEEVRNLAQRSAEAAKNTSSLIEGSQRNADNGVRATKELMGILGEINASIKKVSGLIGEVTAASEEQSQGISQVNEAVAQMDQVTQQNAANAEESSSASEELAAQAQQLLAIVGELTLIVNGTGAHEEFGGGMRSTDMGVIRPAPQKASDADANKNKMRISMKKHSEKTHGVEHARQPAKKTARAEEIIPMEKDEFASI